MQLSEITATVEDQGAGRWFDLLNPVTGEPVGVRLRVIGPDSRGQAEALALMTDDLAEVADAAGRVAGADRERVRRQFLARCVVDWEAVEDGQPVPFSHAALMRLLAVSWVRGQLDAFAINRRIYFAGA